MKKPSKETGITMACPNCKKTLFQGLQFDGNALKETLKCPYCNTKLVREVKKKTVVTLTQLLVVSAIIISIGLFQLLKSNNTLEAIGISLPTIHTK